MSGRARKRRSAWRIVAVMLAVASAARAQSTLTVQADTAILNCPDQVELRVIVDYVGKALDVHFLYGEELEGQRVELRPSPIELPKQHLMQLLASLLRVRDLSMIEESAGFYRIVRAEQATRSVSAILAQGAPLDSSSLKVVTQVVPLPTDQVKDVADKLTRFLSSPKGSVIAVEDQGLLIVTDYEGRIAVLRELIALFDTAEAEVEMRTIDAGAADPSALASRLTAIVSETHRLRGLTSPPPVVRGDILPGTVTAIGESDEVEAIARLAEQLTPTGVTLVTQSYGPRYLSVDRTRELIDRVVPAPGSGLRPPVAVYEDKLGGRLFITAEPETHEAIRTLLNQEDRPVPGTKRPLRIYRPEHRKASELLATLTQLLGEEGGGEAIQVDTAQSRDLMALRETPRPVRDGRQDPLLDGNHLPLESSAQLRVSGADFVLTVDEHTNSIVAIGTREFHAQLEALIEDLDQRRPPG